MPPIKPRRANAYTGSPLDRVAHRRDYPAWIDRALQAPRSLWAPVWRGRNLMRGIDGGAPEAVLLTGEAAAAIRLQGGPWGLLGVMADETPVFAVDAGDTDDPAPLLPDDIAGFADLRAAAGLLPPSDAAILAHARGLMHWRGRNRFCGNCGSPTQPRSAGNTTQCESCGTQHFARTDPAVIMLVTHGERALLAHSPRFPHPRMYSTLAGFVEPGESLEEAVAREVFEETGVRVANIHYHSSQPWPFPASIMLGFYAEALDTEIRIDAVEVSDARWFSRSEVGAAEAHDFVVPRADSIARRLIDDWMEST